MKEILKSFKENVKSISGFIAVSVTEIESGISYDSEAIDGFDPELASAYNLEVVKAKLNAIKVLGLKEDIEDITITLNGQVHIINVAPSGAYFIYLAVDSSKANLGITKSLLNKHKQELYSAL
ncbi:hypothetical protein C7447_101490 [Tenacibaculum adriaticum]|uniref:Roadblock/LAMTOR2 domain-containing protein n=1 Tax=Tenacibaculum adriaticum TaxID=413713 RepID=A0A5S5DVC3_9FLAO|nr:hypothetical protein [Tenacibaculum adriaticum]TYP99883.1 hypothetical protein C7447_101490 [Tenacibaculum adriaticum]